MRQLSKKSQQNKGFTLIELLIAMAILSIVMLMVGQFMSTTSGSYRKTKKNLNVQTEAQQVMDHISDTLMQANYIRVSCSDGNAYEIAMKSDGTTKENRTVTQVADMAVNYDFVPDDYGNYVKPSDADERKAIINYSTYQLVNLDGAKAVAYPKVGDYEYSSTENDVRSFRALRPSVDYYYVKPDYIYAEYIDDVGHIKHIIYYIKDEKIYIYRYTDNSKDKLYDYAKAQVTRIASSSGDGLLTDKIEDFYLSADVDGDALLTNVLFINEGYQYNAIETINFRNSNVLSVRPQNLFKLVSGGSSTEAASSEASSEASPATP